MARERIGGAVKLTKFEHACFTVEKDGAYIVVDLGNLTTDFIPPENVVAVIITHSHPDHLDKEQLGELFEDNPAAVLIAPLEITREFPHLDTRPSSHGDSFSLGGFDIDVYGSTHATIYPDIETPHNIGVLIEDRLFYPGDALTIPDKSVDCLALPIGAPWLKVSEAIDYMIAIGARLTFPTHDATLSADGKAIYDRLIQDYAEEATTTYKRLNGESLEIE